MEDKDIQTITVLIAGRPYPLKINAGDEPAIRQIVKEVNEKINEFQLTYNNKDKQDCLSMALLTYAVDLHKTEKEGTTTPDSALSDKVKQLDDYLNQLLQ
ncbi:MAG: cell division protein ZapA [Bacteroidota bacterium]